MAMNEYRFNEYRFKDGISTLINMMIDVFRDGGHHRQPHRNAMAFSLSKAQDQMSWNNEPAALGWLANAATVYKGRLRECLADRPEVGQHLVDEGVAEDSRYVKAMQDQAGATPRTVKPGEPDEYVDALGIERFAALAGDKEAYLAAIREAYATSPSP